MVDTASAARSSRRRNSAPLRSYSTCESAASSSTSRRGRPEPARGATRRFQSRGMFAATEARRQHVPDSSPRRSRMRSHSARTVPSIMTRARGRPAWEDARTRPRRGRTGSRGLLVPTSRLRDEPEGPRGSRHARIIGIPWRDFVVHPPRPGVPGCTASASRSPDTQRGSPSIAREFVRAETEVGIVLLGRAPARCQDTRVC